MFYGLATNPDYFKENISAFIALAPCSFIKNPNENVSYTAENLYWVMDTIDYYFAINEVRHFNYYIIKAHQSTCKQLTFMEEWFPATFSELCDWGMDLEEAMTYNKVVRGSGTSMRNLRHHYQNFKKKDFFKYDPKFSVDEIPLKPEDDDLPSWWRYIKAEVKKTFKET